MSEIMPEAISETATQDIIAIAILAAACAYLLWRGYRMVRGVKTGKKTGCGCDTCPVKK
jgi:threonine/homoserine/homoserine lactone efflux protein